MRAEAPIERPAGFQTAHDVEHPVIAAVERGLRAGDQRLGAERHRHVEGPADFDTEEGRWRDADDLEGIAVERQRASEHRRIAAELPLPEPMAQDERREPRTRGDRRRR